VFHEVIPTAHIIRKIKQDSNKQKTSYKEVTVLAKVFFPEADKCSSGQNFPAFPGKPWSMARTPMSHFKGF
jgi:hypothetical protein